MAALRTPSHAGIASRVIFGEAGERAVDERGVRLGHCWFSEAEAVHGAGPEVFDDDISGLDEASRYLAVALLL